MDLKKLVYVAPSPIHGKGLFAKKRIPKGAFLGTYEGPQAKRNGSHVLWVYSEDEEPIGRRGMNVLRYLNHAENPKAEFDGFDLFSIKTINAGDEITINYESAGCQDG